jgi:hypothetical protein
MLVNFAATPASVVARGVVAVASDGVGEGAAFAGTLAPGQAVVLRT